MKHEMKLFVVTHSSWGYADVKTVFGVFSSKKKADKAMNDYIESVGGTLSGRGESFDVEETTLNKYDLD
jgi:hypothetical protein